MSCRLPVLIATAAALLAAAPAAAAPTVLSAEQRRPYPLPESARNARIAARLSGATSPPKTWAKQNARSLSTSTRRSTCIALDDITASVQSPASRRTTSVIPGTSAGA